MGHGTNSGRDRMPAFQAEHKYRVQLIITEDRGPVYGQREFVADSRSNTGDKIEGTFERVQKQHRNMSATTKALYTIFDLTDNKLVYKTQKNKYSV